MKIKKCVGAVIYDSDFKIFLMTSKKWKGGMAYTIPGGEINEDESKQRALHREIGEETSMEISDLIYVGETFKHAGKDFYKPDVNFHFFDYLKFRQKFCRV